MEQIAETLGRLHVLMLHFPLGILLMVFGLELYARFKNAAIRPAIHFALGLGAGTAVLTAGCGWLLAEHGHYPSPLLEWHQWLGIATAVLSVFAWLLQGSRVYFPVLCATICVLIPAGHAGGSLTHGADYLWRPPADTQTPQVALASAASVELPVFEGWIQPILQNRCVSCHRTGKAKGGLILKSAAGLRKGGRNGAVVVAGNVAESALVQRMLLPVHEKEHMPPVGKPQASAAEIDLIRWWIEQGASDQTLIGDVTAPEAILNQIQAAVPAHPLAGISVKAPDPKLLAALRAEGIRIDPMGEGSPLYAVSLVDHRSLSRDLLQQLRILGKNIVHLDASGSGLSDEQADLLAGLPHLQRLNVSRTPVGDRALQHLKNARYLEYLNISGTRVGDAGLDAIAGLPALKTLYTWNSGISQAGRARLSEAHVGLDIIAGAPDDTTKRLALRAPEVVYSRTFFKDTLHAALQFPFHSVELRYTLDQSEPGPESPRYTQPIVLDRTTTLKAIAIKEGWLPSPVAEAHLIRQKNRPVSARLQADPSPKYPAKGAISLFDGVIADLQGADTWLGYQGDDLTVVYDFGKAVEMQRVFVHCLENNAPWIFKPRAVQIWISDDGKAWTSRGTKTFPENTSMQAQKTHILSFSLPSPAVARFAKVRLQSIGRNPVWHPDAGQPCWMFVDEIVVD